MKILNIIALIVARLLPTRTVDGAISFVTKALEALDAAEKASTEKATTLFGEAAALQRRIEQLNETAGSHVADASRAASIRSNLAALTQPAPAA